MKESMSAFDRFTLVAAVAGNAVTEPRASDTTAWHRYRDPETGLSFEAPLRIEAGDGPFDLLVEGQMTLPFVFDVSFMASREISDASPQTLTREMATQWMVDFQMSGAPRVRKVEYPGVDEAWAVTADIEDEAGTIGYSWVTLQKDGRIGCLSASCWCAEVQGREAFHRTLTSISGA